MNKEITDHLDTITSKLNLNNKNNLSKVYLQITNSNAESTIINLGNSNQEINLENKNNYLIIKMEESTFFELRDNKKHPEDLMFDEKIKINK